MNERMIERVIGSAKWETYTNGKEEKARVFNEETLLDLRNEQKKCYVKRHKRCLEKEN